MVSPNVYLRNRLSFSLYRARNTLFPYTGCGFLAFYSCLPGTHRLTNWFHFSDWILNCTLVRCDVLYSGNCAHKFFVLALLPCTHLTLNLYAFCNTFSTYPLMHITLYSALSLLFFSCLLHLISDYTSGLLLHPRILISRSSIVHPLDCYLSSLDIPRIRVHTLQGMPC